MSPKLLFERNGFFMNKQKQKSRQRLQEFLSSFFSDEPKYETKEVNGFVLVKSINGSTNKPCISIFTKESFKKSEQYYSGSQQQVFNN